jgi:hypothetical protein
METAQILAKIKALLKLASNNANENEANAAFALAQQLQTKHRINQAELDAAETLIFVQESVAESTNICTWRNTLMCNIVALNSCQCLWVQKNNIKSLVVFGQRSNVDLCIALYISIAAQIMWRTKFAMQQRNGEKLGAKTYANNYRIGIIDTVSRRLKEVHTKELSQHQTAAIVLRKEDDKVLQALRQQYPLIQSSKTSSTLDKEARIKGQLDGHKIVLKNNKGLIT